MILRLAAVLAVGAAASPAVAHEYWLAPSRYIGTAHQTVELGAVAGTGFRGERKGFAQPRCVRLVVGAARQLDLAPLAREGEFVWARFTPSDSGGTMFAFESNFVPITLPAEEFNRYLETEGLAGPREVRRRMAEPGPGRERYRRCPKAWLAGSDANRAGHPVGMPLEIVPLAIPGRTPRVLVRVLWQGQPLAGALVRAWCAPLAADGSPTDPENRDSVGVAWQARTDAHGEVLARVEKPGEWLISVVHMVACPDTAVADWESTWASLTFVRPRGAGR